MRKIIIGVVLMLLSFKSYSQESVLDIVAKETCEYLKKDEINSLPNKEKTVKLGIFIINQFNKYESEFEKNGYELDLSNSNSSRKFGEKVGINMVKFCPDVIMALANDSGFETKNTTVEEQLYEIGEIIEVVGDEFSTVVVKDIEGKTQKYLWLQNFKGSEELIKNDFISKNKVKIFYKNTECYSPKLKDYVIRKEILEIEFME